MKLGIVVKRVVLSSGFRTGKASAQVHRRYLCGTVKPKPHEDMKSVSEMLGDHDLAEEIERSNDELLASLRESNLRACSNLGKKLQMGPFPQTSASLDVLANNIEHTYARLLDQKKEAAASLEADFLRLEAKMDGAIKFFVGTSISVLAFAGVAAFHKRKAPSKVLD